MTTANRFTAEWIHRQHETDGEWDPDLDEYMSCRCASLEDAKRVAIEESKRAGCVEWVAVMEEAYNDELGLSPRSDAAWDVVGRWSGDWDGNWERIS